MEKAKAATTVGILVGTLATGNDVMMTSLLLYTIQMATEKLLTG